MANPFEAGFPGKAVGKGNAQVIDNEFDPHDAPPVDVADPSNVPPVEPEAGPPVDLATLLPILPPVHFLGNSEQDMDFPGELPDFFEDIF